MSKAKDVKKEEPKKATTIKQGNIVIYARGYNHC